MIDYASLEDKKLQSLASSGDREAEETLAGRYLRLVRACARPFFLAGGDSEDLIQEGTFGLLSAIRQYRADVGASFKTFAEHCIRRSRCTIIGYPRNLPAQSGRACSGEREQGRTLRGLFQMPFTV